ncbi:MAG: sensor histidine kinase [Solirubrobacteraceae bacterium]
MHVLEGEVERLSARVAQLEREKAQVEAFAAVAAHELVEPLIMTEAYASIVSDRLGEPEHADSRRDLHALSRGVSRMRLLAESLLHDARASGRQLERKPVDVTALVGDCIGLLQPEIASRDARIELGELPDAVGEEALLSGVFSNLLINALKYSPRRGAGIRVGGAREEAACRFFVESEGPTVPHEDRRRIFEIYQRGQGERRASGAGLGLTICRRIVERHGGEIGVVSVNGSGNRFFFTLPA